MFENNQSGTWGQPTGGPQHKFIPAHEQFRSQLGQAWPSPEAEQAVINAYAAYTAVLQQPWLSPELNQKLIDAYGQYRQRIREAFTTGNADKVIDSFRQYVRDLKNVWAEIDPESISSEDLGAIAQGMLWVASVAYEVAVSREIPREPRS